MYRYQTPQVIEQMAYDYADYGFCSCLVVDTPNEFMIKRYQPFDYMYRYI